MNLVVRASEDRVGVMTKMLVRFRQVYAVDIASQNGRLNKLTFGKRYNNYKRVDYGLALDPCKGLEA